MGTFSIWHWLIVLVIVALVFGTKKLRNMGEDLGSAVKGFKKGMADADDTSTPQSVTQQQNAQADSTIDVKTTEKSDV